MVNVFSFCLYGPENPRYYPGMLENVFLAGKYFPTWKVYVYYAPDVEESMLNTLGACSSVELRPTGVLGAPNMIHRFYAIDEPGVDMMMVRDADSRIHYRDRWAIREFVKSNFLAHTIRDNEQHTARMMGGLWGIRKSAGISLREAYASYVEDMSRGHRVAHDQNFLADVIYPKVLPSLMIHSSIRLRFRDEHVFMIPFEWSNEIFCGRVEMNFRDIHTPRSQSILQTLPQASVRVLDTSFRG